MKQTKLKIISIILGITLFSALSSIVSAYSTPTQNTFKIQLIPKISNSNTYQLPIQHPIEIPINSENLTFKINSILSDDIRKINTTIKESNNLLSSNLTYSNTQDIIEINLRPVYETPQNISLNVSTSTGETISVSEDSKNDRIKIPKQVLSNVFIVQQATKLGEAIKLSTSKYNKTFIEDFTHTLTSLFNKVVAIKSKDKILITLTFFSRLKNNQCLT